jgi:hypothetical protein
MDMGRARYRQAHKLPSERAETLVLAVAVAVLIGTLIFGR